MEDDNMKKLMAILTAVIAMTLLLTCAQASSSLSWGSHTDSNGKLSLLGDLGLVPGCAWATYYASGYADSTSLGGYCELVPSSRYPVRFVFT